MMLLPPNSKKNSFFIIGSNGYCENLIKSKKIRIINMFLMSKYIFFMNIFS